MHYLSLTDVSYLICHTHALEVHLTHTWLFTGGQFPLCVSIVGLSGLQTIVIGATDSADGASVRSTITADIGSEFLWVFYYSRLISTR